jgi:hypothetical protein
MRIAALLLIALLFVSATGVAHSYLLPDPTELAKRFAELEAIAQDPTPEARSQLVSVCLSKSERVQYKRLAYRLLSRIALPGDLDRLPAADPSDQLWSCRKIAEIRIAARKNGDSKKAIADQLKSFYASLSASLDSGTGGQRIITGVEKRLAEQEIGYQIGDQGLPTDSFPSELVDRSVDAQTYLLTKKYSANADPGEHARLLLRELKTANPFRTQALVALLGELGEPSLPMVVSTLHRSVPDHNPPPFDKTTNMLTSCLHIIADIGGPQGQAVLKEYAKSKFPYVASYAEGCLRWSEKPVKYPARYLELFQHPYADE